LILIADSGSTKTAWTLLEGDVVTGQWKTRGFNPYYQGEEEVRQALREEFLPALGGISVDRVFFYGAGCSTPERKSVIERAIGSFLPESRIEVNNDLLGAARSLCGHQPGIVCIVGTGSGSCFYDGSVIARNIPSLGFILGDEGSGAYIGKKLITDFLREDMPATIHEAIRKEYGIDKESVLEQVNKRPMPSRYLAGFSRFVTARLGEPYLFDLAYHALKDFAMQYIVRYDNYQEYSVHFIGGVAYHNRTVLAKIAGDLSFRLGRIEEQPMEGLIRFHTESTTKKSAL
jgi:glucosamine kinase